MKIGRIQIMTDRNFQRAKLKAVRMDQIQRDSMRNKLLDLSVQRYGELEVKYKVLQKAIFRRAKN